MKSLDILFLVSLFFISCSSSELKNDFNCTNSSFSNLEKTSDIRSLFTVTFPKNWKVNLYYDNSQTSIYAADTTKPLTKSTLIDITYIHNSINFDDAFLLKLIEKEKELQLKNIKAKKVIFLEKPSYIQQSKGQKGKYSYQILNIYSKINSDNFLLSKVEIYGDSLIKERLCKAINLLEKIEMKGYVLE